MPLLAPNPNTLKRRMNLGQIDTRGTESAALIPINGDDDKDKDISTSEMLVSNSSLALDDFYPSVAIATLMRIIRDPTLSQHHTAVVQAVVFIFKSLGIKAVPYISQVRVNAGLISDRSHCQKDREPVSEPVTTELH